MASKGTKVLSFTLFGGVALLTVPCTARAQSGWTVHDYIFDSVSYTPTSWDHSLITMAYTSPPPAVWNLNHASGTQAIVYAFWHSTATYSGSYTPIGEISVTANVQGTTDGTPAPGLQYSSFAHIDVPSTPTSSGHIELQGNNPTYNLNLNPSPTKFSYYDEGYLFINGDLWTDTTNYGGYSYATYTGAFALGESGGA